MKREKGIVSWGENEPTQFLSRWKQDNTHTEALGFVSSILCSSSSSPSSQSSAGPWARCPQRSRHGAYRPASWHRAASTTMGPSRWDLLAANRAVMEDEAQPGHHGGRGAGGARYCRWIELVVAGAYGHEPRHHMEDEVLMGAFSASPTEAARCCRWSSPISGSSRRPSDSPTCSKVTVDTIMIIKQ